MKKIYFTIGLGVLFLGANAQQTLKIKNTFTKARHDRNIAARNGNSHNGVSQVAGTITSNNDYVAGTTMNLSLTLDLTNTDGEYGDSLAITFPAGITPNTNTITPNPFPAIDQGTGYVSDALNPIVGQTVSWGVNDNGQYGGISAGLGGVTFQINVTITAGLTGPQTANFFVSGDTYTTSTSTHGDLTGGTFVINPAFPKNLAAIAGLATSGCALASNSTVLLEFWNRGTAAQSGFPVQYISNSGTPVVETYTGTVNPGDTVVYVFTTPIAMVANTVYDVQISTNLSGDGDVTNDGTTTVGYTSDNVPYTSGFETTPETDLTGWVPQQVTGTGNTWNIDAQLPYAGAQEALLLGAVGLSDDWIFSPCLNLTTGKTYKVKYYHACFKNSTILGAGSLGVFLGTKDSAQYMTTTVKALTTLTAVTIGTATANVAAYKVDSATFTVPATGTYVLGFEGKNTQASKQALIALDNISVTEVLGVGIKTLTNNTDLSIYPNPTNGVLNISTTAATATVEIYNIMGQNVFSKSITNGTSTIDISNLSNGVYSVQIMQNNTLTVGKIIKSN